MDYWDRNRYMFICIVTVLTTFKYGCVCASQPPHIIFILIDDLGWYDVGFHGQTQIPTPNIDWLAGEGIILNNYYVQQLCTPTRSALMTGRYPIHTGLQHGVIFAGTTCGLPLNETLLPQYLKPLGYKTHMVGKWHLGMYAKEYTPLYRGFDTFYGYYNGMEDHFSHGLNFGLDFSGPFGVDLHDSEEPVFSKDGEFSTELFTSVAEDIISSHDPSEPLFLYLAYQSIHAPLQAPQEWIDKFSYIDDDKRRTMAAMLSYIDYGIGRVYAALQKYGLLHNSLIAFSTDNGGMPTKNWSSNWPLRGSKRTLWEGGVRGVGFIHGNLLNHPSTTTSAMMHVTDWLPTLLHVAGADPAQLSTLDGCSMWDTIQNEVPSPRKEILLNIDRKGAGLRVGEWKIVVGQDLIYSNWYTPAGIHGGYGNLTVSCGPKPSTAPFCLHVPCLFNMKDDPCEYVDRSIEEEGIYQQMLHRLEEYRAGAVKSLSNRTVDPAANPDLHGGSWEPWIVL